MEEYGEEELEWCMEELEREHLVRCGGLRVNIEANIINSVNQYLKFIFNDEIYARDEYFNNNIMNTISAKTHNHEYQLLGQEPVD